MRKWWLQWLQQQSGWWLELNLLQYALTKPYWSQVGGGSRIWSENELTRLKRSPRRNPAFKGINSEFWWRGQIILMEKMKWFNWQDCHKNLLWSGRKGGGVRWFDFKFADLSGLHISLCLFKRWTKFTCVSKLLVESPRPLVIKWDRIQYQRVHQNTHCWQETYKHW